MPRIVTWDEYQAKVARDRLEFIDKNIARYGSADAAAAVLGVSRNYLQKVRSYDGYLSSPNVRKANKGHVARKQKLIKFAGA